MPGTPPTSPRHGAPRYADGDAASFSAQVNAITDRFDITAGRFESGLLVNRPSTGAGIADRFYFATDDTSGGPSGTLYRDAGGATPTWQRINVANAEAAFSTYKLVERGGAEITAGAASYVLGTSASGLLTNVSNTGATSGRGVFYFDPAQYAAGTRATKLYLRGMVITNAVAPGISYTFSLTAVAGIGGASGAAPTATAGAAVTGSALAVNTPAGSTTAAAVSGDFAAPASGSYFILCTTSGTPAAGSWVNVQAQLYVRQV